MADVFSEVLGKQISFIDITPEEMADALKSIGFPGWQADGLIEDYAHYARGEASAVYNTVKDISGSNAISFREFVKDYKNLFV